MRFSVVHFISCARVNCLLLCVLENVRVFFVLLKHIKHCGFPHFLKLQFLLLSNLLLINICLRFVLCLYATSTLSFSNSGLLCAIVFIFCPVLVPSVEKFTIIGISCGFRWFCCCCCGCCRFF